ncbi:LytTR family DNA-binding domain-containing protein [Halobacillus karajensis]|uniref:HTH-type transcriptional regulator n=1 Tax=Halobacillus karajensis TaxID=195088 RepID=A0A024P8H0_9BACI|nr:LytTR family DNA-binding domain-containing protein [Halobacillus karajensis]CDQ20308.1 putative HTH-type transcriptional regulator [Halobacillus karajensis]CDQ25031.1 putative HTH-type transcriptional regulator [Halobacillus karajensis]CDQ28608.1 putative HTH-type transcriptional regulator [Halobacillus karajensis]
MKILIDINEQYKETEVTVRCKKVDRASRKILDALEEETDLLIGTSGERQHILKPDSIDFFYTELEIVHASTTNGDYKMKEKLYELQDRLPSQQFIRISKSVIANLYHISHFEPSFHGTVIVYFHSGRKEYASRHYVRKIKKILNMNRRNRS